MKELGPARVFSREAEEDLLIEAMAPVEGSDEFRSIAFRASRIDFVYAIDEKLSGITLNNGVTIPVAVAFPELKQRIYNNDYTTGGSIDLTLVSGRAVKDAGALRLAKKFNPAAEDTAPKKEAELDIVVYAHAKPNDREFRRLRLPESLIGHFEPHVGRKDKETFIKLKNGKSLDGWDSFYVAIPITNFTYYLNQAKNGGQSVLELGEVTRPKDTSVLKVD